MALLVLGPAGAGKTTICRALVSRLYKTLGCKVAYLSGDSFAALRYPRTFSDGHLAFKYERISAEIRRLSEDALVIDDLFRRRSDFDEVSTAAAESGFHVVARKLDVPLDEVLRRNRSRQPPARMPEKRLIRVYQKYSAVDLSDIPSLASSWSADRIAMQLAQGALESLLLAYRH